jgi:hypothetical protein
MSKPSRRPGREALKAQRKERQRGQRQLRERQQEDGLTVPTRPSLSNRTCPYQNEEEERAARLDAVGQQVKVYRSMLPVLLTQASLEITFESIVTAPFRAGKDRRAFALNAKNRHFKVVRPMESLLIANCAAALDAFMQAFPY